MFALDYRSRIPSKDIAALAHALTPRAAPCRSAMPATAKKVSNKNVGFGAGVKKAIKKVRPREPETAAVLPSLRASPLRHFVAHNTAALTAAAAAAAARALR